MRQPLGGTGSRSSSALGSGAGAGGQALERALERGGERVRRRRRPRTRTPGSCPTKWRRKCALISSGRAASSAGRRARRAGGRRGDRRRGCARRTARTARGRRCGARRSGRSISRRVRSSSAAREGRPHEDVGEQRQVGVEVARQHLALEAGRVRRTSDTSSVAPSASSAASSSSRDLPPAPRRAHSAARLVSPSRWRGSAAEPERDATTTCTSGTRLVALDDQQRAGRPGPRARPRRRPARPAPRRPSPPPPPAPPTAAPPITTRASPFGRATTTERAPVARYCGGDRA